MASQKITILKVPGKSAHKIANNILKSRSKKRRCQRFVDNCKRHYLEKPFVYYSVHIDLWSSPMLFDPILNGAGFLGGVDFQSEWAICSTYFYRTPDISFVNVLREYKKMASRNRHWAAEIEQLRVRLNEAFTAYNELQSYGLLVILREPYDVSPSDDEIVSWSKKTPKWLERFRK